MAARNIQMCLRDRIEMGIWYEILSQHTPTSDSAQWCKNVRIFLQIHFFQINDKDMVFIGEQPLEGALRNLKFCKTTE